MSLLRVHRVALPIRTLANCRGFSLNSIYPSKVRAYPFNLSPEDAALTTAIFGCLYRDQSQSNSPNLHPDFIRSVAARALSMAGLNLFSPRMPKRLTPVYLPAWIFDAEIEAIGTSQVPQQNPPQTLISRILLNSYLPGTAFTFLSSYCFRSDALQLEDTVPFSPDLKVQHGQEITVLPFTMTPFSLLDSARTSLPNPSQVTESFSFDPTSLRCRMAAAYPILIPLYLVEYEKEASDMGGPFTLVIEAYMDKIGGNIIHEEFTGGLADTFRTSEPGQKPIRSLTGDAVPFVQLEQASGKDHDGLSEWLDHKLAMAPTLPEIGSVDMTDARIREFCDEEIQPVRHCLRIAETLRVLKLLNQKGEEVAAKLGADPFDMKVDEDIIGKMEETYAKTIPSWWKDSHKA